jgi:toluene monooxygenase system ferredoxin subunit
MGELQRICDAGDLWDGEMDAFEVGGEEVLLIKLDGCFHAYQGICPHQSVRLAEGTLEGRTLTCRAHLWQFDAHSGAGLNPRNQRLRRHAVKVIDGGVYVETEPGA